MSFKLPPDVENDLQKRFPEVHIPTVIDAIFQSILTKITKDASCTVREFGKFVAFVTKSQRTLKDSVRFKFKLSSALNQKIKTDQYLINNLPVKATNEFSEKHEKKCRSKKEQRKANLEAKSKATKVSKTKTNEALVLEKVQSIVNKG
jgi:nucleoid DNA-binding protein